MAAQPVRRRTPGLAFAAASALAFGGAGVAARPLLEAGMEPLHVTWLRMAGAALALAPVALARWRLVLHRPLLVLGYGIFPMAGVQALYFAAVARIPVGVALLLEFTGPVLVLLWFRLVRRRRVSAWAVAGVVLAVAGLVLLLEVWAGLRLDAVGVSLALGAAAGQAGYLLLSDAAGEDTDPLALVASGALVATVVLGALAGPWDLPWAVLAEPLPLGGARLPGWVLALWLGLVCTAVAYFTGVAAIRRLSPQVAGGVAYLEVVTAIVLAWVLLGEALSPVQVLGAVVIVAGACVSQAAVPSGREAQATVPEAEPDLR
ncbi:EamA family transporter [Nocardiopsis sp. LOL_012]|uniref:EamA family transporter n=1 Tax=Nocardiopsis sp. LOL_012 TaxID=3345409 RepID=UPI003A85AEC5